MASELHRAVTVRGLTRSYGGRAVLDGLDLSLGAGQFTVLLGRRGCGKSTLVRVLAGIDREVSGTVLVPRRRAVVFPAARLTPWRRMWRNASETQRVALAQALARDPDLLLLDEPFGGLDAADRLAAWRLVGESWRRRGRTVLLVGDDVDEALLLADRVLVMRDGVVVYDAPVGPDRPRSPADPGFAALRARLLAELGADEDVPVPLVASSAR
ncbi:ATP-binding cassette domain-containing protein [Streptomyces sp. NPDC094032]|uniref:ATP-binding cassette domain-containing protein n=1 Tax=Streptomyces sp. NPDC094032 TaxID=3155308 RepID=UPI003327B8B2